MDDHEYYNVIREDSMTDIKGFTCDDVRSLRRKIQEKSLFVYDNPKYPRDILPNRKFNMWQTRFYSFMASFFLFIAISGLQRTLKVYWTYFFSRSLSLFFCLILRFKANSVHQN